MLMFASAVAGACFLFWFGYRVGNGPAAFENGNIARFSECVRRDETEIFAARQLSPEVRAFYLLGDQADCAAMNALPTIRSGELRRKTGYHIPPPPPRR